MKILQSFKAIIKKKVDTGADNIEDYYQDLTDF